MKSSRILFLLLPTLIFFTAIPATAEMVLDAVIASVDGDPITLKDVSQRIPGRPTVKISDLASKGVALDALNALIEESLISAEASDRKITVDDNDINSYIKVVADQNHLSPEAFTAALHERGIDADQYRHQIRYEVLRSKIASSVAQTAASVSDEELQSAVGGDDEKDTENTEAADSVFLRQIVILRNNRSEEEFQNKIGDVGHKLLAKEPFATVAQSDSESSEGKEGGSLGVVHLGDLSEDIQNQIVGLQPGQISKPLITPESARFFMIDQSGDVSGSSAKKMVMEDARAKLKQGKAMQTIDDFFAKGIREKHVVEKYL